MNKKILIAVHPGFMDTPAIRRGITVAHAADVEVMLYSAVYDEYIPNLCVVDDQIEKMHKKILQSENVKLDAIKSRFVDVAKSVETLSQWNYSIVDGILEAAKSFKADLIIISSTRHKTVARLFLSNTDWEVLRRSSIPVIFAHQHPNKPYKKVIVAVDPTHDNDKAAELENRMIKLGKWICELFGGELHLAHAHPFLGPEMAVDYIIPVSLNDELKEKHQETLSKLAKKHDIPEQNVHFLDGYPRIAIPEFTREMNADLVVMGITSRSFLDRLVIGSTAEYLLDHLECDVLTVQTSHNLHV